MPFSVFIPCKYLSADFVISNAKFFHFSRKATARPSVAAIIIAVAFSMAIGVFFGYYPAKKAAKMDPIDALRYE